ncbi:hypothetical protein A5482_014605 (plasmid) [Cyanobacterium sp. IPPAS B-1200]|uniref:hypothetical protein n=1 Tax=Cyanobacterium sp. IPPAS B-1200 TaxID=1562720 RepID=UPI000852748B|nr:hypothetical protein [Cyanobacterium sp. IPPAS B-1200]OEJ77595.1 hypothetical protein A5482_15330 [Cyanobacterium sp. IPPAS B-1200]
MTEIDTAKLERQKRREEFRLDNLKTRLDELTRDEIFTLEQYILVNYRRCSQKHTAYGLKQRLTSETGIYIYQMDMYNLMKGLGVEPRYL